MDWRSKINGISSVCVLIVMVCVLATVGFDGTYQDAPLTSDSATGRIYAHSIKWIGTVYLTAAEYQPYRWLFGTAMAAVAIFVSLRVWDGLSKRKNERRAEF